MKKFYFHDGVNQQGPFALEELRSKTIKKETPVWYEGLSDWTTAGNVDELKDIVIAVPPVFQSKVATYSPAQESISQQRKPTEKPKSDGSFGRRLLLWGGVIVLALIGVYAYNQVKQQQVQVERQNAINTEEDVKAEIRKNITSYVTAERSAYNYSNLGGIYNLKISVTNSTDYVLDNVKVKITYYKANGGVWKTRFVDFNMVPPQTKVTLPIPDTERGTSVDYEIASIKSNALGLN